MMRFSTARWATGWALFLTAGIAGAADNHFISRTYFGPPGVGPYQMGPGGHGFKQPWCAKICGVRCCATPEQQEQRYLEKYQIVQARYMADMAKLQHWREHMAHHLGHGAPGGVGQCDCGRACGGPTGYGLLGLGCPKCGGHGGLFSHFRHRGCGSSDCGKQSCGSGGCGHYPNLVDMIARKHRCTSCTTGCATLGESSCSSCGGGGCASCGGSGHAAPVTEGPHGGHGAAYAGGPAGPGAYQGAAPGGGHPWHHPKGGLDPRTRPPYMHPGYPGMNREDAVRYIEGFQYYPPYHLLRSPRDFFMFDVKYGIGR